MLDAQLSYLTVESPPTRGCELKFTSKQITIPNVVTPHAGVRIEILLMLPLYRSADVTPHAGVRIEIDVLALNKMAAPSPPTRGCELKFFEPFRQAET